MYIFVLQEEQMLWETVGQMTRPRFASVRSLHISFRLRPPRRENARELSSSNQVDLFLSVNGLGRTFSIALIMITVLEQDYQHECGRLSVRYIHPCSRLKSTCIAANMKD
jgi:hypothetical protein